MKLTMTSINSKQSKLKRGLSALALTLLVLLLSACGGKKVSTKDNSVDYKSAQALPPLKKSSRVVVTPPVTPTPEVSEASLPSVVQAEPINEPQKPVASANEANKQTPQFNANVVSAKSGQARLEVEADFDQAWDYLSSSLQKSDLTVFSRNKAAGRFSIGCSTFAAAPTVVKSGRWSIFNRNKQKILEHCALQVLERRGTTVVSVLNRAGEEVSGEYSNDVFSRILNN